MNWNRVKHILTGVLSVAGGILPVLQVVRPAWALVGVALGLVTKLEVAMGKDAPKS